MVFWAMLPPKYSQVGFVSGRALLHKYLKPLRGKDRQLKALIDKTLYDKAFRRKAESLCNNALWQT
jgi:hypothetical protein